MIPLKSINVVGFLDDIKTLFCLFDHHDLLEAAKHRLNRCRDFWHRTICYYFKWLAEFIYTLYKYCKKININFIAAVMVVLRSIFILNSVIIDSHMGLYWRFICHQKNHINQTLFCQLCQLILMAQKWKKEWPIHIGLRASKMSGNVQFWVSYSFKRYFPLHF